MFDFYVELLPIYSMFNLILFQKMESMDGVICEPLIVID